MYKIGDIILVTWSGHNNQSIFKILNKTTTENYDCEVISWSSPPRKYYTKGFRYTWNLSLALKITRFNTPLARLLYV